MTDAIDSLRKINDALEGLEQDEIRRVLRFTVDQWLEEPEPSLGAALGGGASTTSSGSVGGNVADRGGSDSASNLTRITDLMDAASPHSIVEHVLVASYWFQVVKGQEDFASQEVNSELKDLGRYPSNITDSYNTLMKRKPAPLVRQVQKSGTTKQARKRFRLTAEGIKVVEKMIAAPASSEDNEN